MDEGSAVSRQRSLLKGVRDALARPIESRFGPLRALRDHRRTLGTIPSVRQALATFDARWPEDRASHDEQPVFILSAGWRSGSTLLQRLILSGNDALIWGEPYDHCDLVRRLADSLRALGPEYPPDHFTPERQKLSGAAALSGEWVANMYPHPRHLLHAHRAFFLSLYQAPATAAGFMRWGFKEVRLGVDYAAYIAWLFPAARFVFLYRNPYRAYRSYRRFRGWYDRWPTEPVLTAKQFGIRWRRLAGGFAGEHGLAGALTLRYEDLVRDDSVISRLSDHVGMTLRSEVLGERIAGAGSGRVKPQPATRSEVRALRRQVEPLASRLGYAP
ncbi:MAG: sulfotransferase [Gemmatimonadales bacterium]|jgi:hypothetical protein